MTVAQDAAARWNLWRFLLGLNGRQKSCWLPSWGRELQLTEAMNDSARRMQIRPVAGIAAHAGRAIAFEIGGGLACRSIVSGSEDGPEHVLTLSASLGADLPVTTPIHVLTSNLPFDEWTEVFGSERLTGAIPDRLTHPVHILEMDGERFRQRQSRKAKS